MSMSKLKRVPLKPAHVRHMRLIRRAWALQRHNSATVGIWGHMGIMTPLARRDLWPVPLTGMRVWMRRGEFRLFSIYEFDLVD